MTNDVCSQHKCTMSCTSTRTSKEHRRYFPSLLPSVQLLATLLAEVPKWCISRYVHSMALSTTISSTASTSLRPVSLVAVHGPMLSVTYVLSADLELRSHFGRGSGGTNYFVTLLQRISVCLFSVETTMFWTTSSKKKAWKQCSQRLPYGPLSGTARGYSQ